MQKACTWQALKKWLETKSEEDRRLLKEERKMLSDIIEGKRRAKRKEMERGSE